MDTHHLALITGATSGIGEAFARALPAETNLFLTGRNTEKLAQLERELGQPGRAVKTHAADLGTPEGRASLLTALEREPVDLFINNAGLGQMGPFVENTPATVELMTQVNVVATTALAHALLPGMLERARGGGHRCGMIVVSSVAGFMPTPLLGAYGATKAYNLRFAEALWQEFRGDPVDILALCPGETATNFGTRAGLHGHGRSPRSVSAERVVREALAALGKKPVHVVGGLNRCTVTLGNVLPRRIFLPLAHGLLRKFWRDNKA